MWLGDAAVWDVANKLPPFTDDIAAMLRMLGIRGQRRSATNCPLANLFKLFADGALVVVDADGLIKVGNRAFDQPAVVTAFASMFDDGCYPELIDRPAIEAVRL